MIERERTGANRHVEFVLILPLSIQIVQLGRGAVPDNLRPGIKDNVVTVTACNPMPFHVERLTGKQ